MAQMTFETTGRAGALTTYEIRGDQSALEQVFEKLPKGYVPKLRDGFIEGKGSRRDISAIREMVEIRATETRRAHGASPSRRVIVRAGSVSVGDTVNGNTVTNLGRAWASNADQPAVLGFPPEWDSVQYAYFD